MLDVVNIAKDVFRIEIEGLQAVANNLDGNFTKAVDCIINTNGRVIICGMGKSGIVGQKIAASFASTGTPSFFMHPGEAFHGDLGMVKSEDVFIAISNSGETEEVLKLLPFLRDNENTIIAITGDSTSTLAKNGFCHLDITVPQEACSLQLAPTASTTATIAMGDALTVALMRLRQFKPENFARFHPGGSLGRRLLMRVADEMTVSIPTVTELACFTEIVSEITKGGLGLLLVTVNSSDTVAVITDGDIRRAMDSFQSDVFDITAAKISTKNPKTIASSASLSCAYEKMDVNKVNALFVVEDGRIVGVIKK